MSEPVSRWSAAETIGKGVQAAPALRIGFVTTLFLALMGAAGRVVTPILVQQAIDRGLSPSGVSVDTVVRLGLVALFVICLATWAQRTAVYRLGRRSEEALYGLRVRLFEHIHRLSIADHSEERKGALVARVTSDVETLAQFFQWGGLAWLLDGTLMLLVAGVMLAYDWVLALVAFVVAAPLAFVLQRVQRHLVKAYDASREKNAAVMTQISEVVAGAETLRAYRAGPRYARRVKATSHERSKSFIRAGTIGAFLFPSGEVFGVFTVSAVVVSGLLRGPDSGLTAGAMVGFLFLTYRFLEPIAEFTEVLDQTQTAVAGMRRVLGVLEIPIGPPEPEVPMRLPEGGLAVTVDRVDFSYRSRGDVDEPPVLVDVNVHIPAGQQVAVVGETGSGKTTLGRLVARLADPVAGSVLIGGVPLTRVSNADLRSRLTVVPQEPFLFEAPSPPTCCSPDPTCNAPTSSRQWPSSTSATGSTRCPRGSTPRWVSAARRCRPASGNSSRSSVRRSSTPTCWCSTRPPRRSMRSPRCASPVRWRSSPAAAPPSPSRTGCPRPPVPTGCSCSTTVASSRTVPTPNSSSVAAPMRACTTPGSPPRRRADHSCGRPKGGGPHTLATRHWVSPSPNTSAVDRNVSVSPGCTSVTATVCRSLSPLAKTNSRSME